MLPAVLIYNLLLLSALAAVVIFKAPSLAHASSALVFVPVIFHFTRALKRSLASKPAKTAYSSAPATYPSSSISGSRTTSPLTIRADEVVDGQVLNEPQVHDINKRLFLKLIGSAGLTTFLFSLFTKSSHAAFFGSVPGPGTVAIKDTAGNKIDPAEKQPTDGYEVCAVDDDAPPSYYGFLNKDGGWYIAREDAQGEYRYSRGSSNYPTNWDNRTALAYDYFNNVF